MALTAELAKTRDELKLKAHLFKGEVKDIWKTTEQKWNDLENRVDRVKDAAESSKEEIESALNLLVEEISTSYKKIRKSVKN